MLALKRHYIPVKKMSPFIVQKKQYLRFSNWVICKALLYFGSQYYTTNNFDTNSFGTNNFDIEKALSSCLAN